jgi:hypothetical protein
MLQQYGACLIGELGESYLDLTASPKINLDQVLISSILVGRRIIMEVP